MDILQLARKLQACSDAIGWLEENKHLTVEQLYRQCPRGDWLMWFFARIGVEQKPLALAACGCADLVKHLLPDNALKNTTDIVRAYYKGEATLEDVKLDADAAIYAANAANAASTAAAYTAANAAAYAAIYGTAFAAEAAFAAAAAARTADATYLAMYQQCADIVRKYVSWDAVSKLLLVEDVCK